MRLRSRVAAALGLPWHLPDAPDDWPGSLVFQRLPMPGSSMLDQLERFEPPDSTGDTHDAMQDMLAEMEAQTSVLEAIQNATEGILDLLRERLPAPPDTT